MIWWQQECKSGDMIRVSCGNFYHYGIFVSEKEVIQFGLPPFGGLLNRKYEDIAVCISDIDTFSGGRVVEVAVAEKSDKKRFPPKKTVRLARESLGRKGYHILHNNCEHFARFCYFGEKRCELTDGVISEWKKRTVCDVYISFIPDGVIYEPLIPKERNEEVLSVSNERVKASKYWVWKTLEYAFFRSFGYKIEDLSITRTKTGKWTARECFFSLSHSENIVAVAVSNGETGVDIEELNCFCERFKDSKELDRFADRIVAKKEKTPQNTAELISLWTKKESLFKASNKKAFLPAKLCTGGKDVITFRIDGEKGSCVVSVIGKDRSDFKIYLFDGEGATRIKDVKWL